MSLSSNKNNWLIQFTNIDLKDRENIVAAIKKPETDNSINKNSGLTCAVLGVFNQNDDNYTPTEICRVSSKIVLLQLKLLIQTNNYFLLL